MPNDPKQDASAAIKKDTFLRVLFIFLYERMLSFGQGADGVFFGLILKDNGRFDQNQQNQLIIDGTAV
jgi:hypothetical protein